MSILGRLTGSELEHFVITHFYAHEDGILTEAETAIYRQHLASCSKCQTWIYKQQRFAEGLKSEAPPPAILTPAAAARIQQNITSRIRRAMIMNNIKSFVSATAAFVLLAVIVGFFLGQSYSNNQTEEPVATIQQAAPEPNLPTGTLDEQLVEAVREKDAATVESLLEAGADPNITSANGDPILKTAIFAVNSSMEVIELLVEHGADVNALDKDGNPLLPQVAQKPRPEVVQLLLDAGADVNTKMNANDGPTYFIDAPVLIHAVLGNQAEVVEVLIANGADVNLAERSYQDTALHLAAYGNRAEIVTILLEGGADPGQFNTFGAPLHFAAVNNSLDAIQALLDGGADVNILDGNDLTPMMTAIRDARPPLVAGLVSTFLANGADPNWQDKTGYTALHYAAREGRIEAISLLVEHGADLNLENNGGKTPLDLATNDTVIDLLIELGAEN